MLCKQRVSCTVFILLVPFTQTPCAGYRTGNADYSERGVDIVFTAPTTKAVKNKNRSGNAANGGSSTEPTVDDIQMHVSTTQFPNTSRGKSQEHVSNREDLYSKPDMGKKRKEKAAGGKVQSSKDNESYSSSGSVVMSGASSNYSASSNSLDITEVERPLSIA